MKAGPRSIGSDRLDSSPQVVRRLLVLGVVVGYPLFVAAWLGLPTIGVSGIAWAVIVAVVGVSTMLGAFGLYGFRVSMAHRPDAELDERQLAVRDRAYLESYRVLAVAILLGLIVLGIGSDLVDRPLSLTYDTVQPVIWGALLYTLILPSAVIAWQEPDLPAEA